MKEEDELDSLPDWVEKIQRGEMALGPATTTLFLPILLPWRCCDAARAERCGRCPAIGYTHGGWRFPDLRCLDCDENLAPAVKAGLRQR